MIVFSESRDRGSQFKSASVIEKAHRVGVSIYMATYSAHATPWTAKPEDNPPLPMGPDFIGGIIQLGRMGKGNDGEPFTRGTGGGALFFPTLHGVGGSASPAGGHAAPTKHPT